MLLTNSQLHIFHTVVAQGGFAAAAKSLGLDPSTVSKTISRIEEQLAMRLIDRSTRAFAVTQEGVILAQACADALQTMQGALNELALMNDEVSGRLRVYTTCAIAEHRLAPLMVSFHRLHPAVNVEFIINRAFSDAVQAGVDISLSHQIPQRDDMITRLIGETRRVLVATPHFIDRYGRPDCLEDIGHMPCIGMTSDAVSAWQFNLGNESRQISVRGPFRASSETMLLRLALQGLGLAVLSQEAVAPHLENGALLELSPGGAAPQPSALYASYHERKLPSCRVRAFVDFLSDAL